MVYTDLVQAHKIIVSQAVLAEKNKEESVCVQMIFIIRDRDVIFFVMGIRQTAVIMETAVLAA